MFIQQTGWAALPKDLLYEVADYALSSEEPFGHVLATLPRVCKQWNAHIGQQSKSAPQEARDRGVKFFVRRQFQALASSDQDEAADIDLQIRLKSERDKASEIGPWIRLVCRSGNVGCLDVALKCWLSDGEIPDYVLRPILEESIQSGLVSFVDCLMKRKGNALLDLRYGVGRSANPLHVAAQQLTTMSGRIVTRLLAHVQNKATYLEQTAWVREGITLWEYRETPAHTPLQVAISYLNHSAVRAFIHLGADIAASTHYPDNALCHKRDNSIGLCAEICRLHLKKHPEGAESVVLPMLRTILNTEKVPALLDSGQFLHTYCQDDANLPLVEELLNYGANVNSLGDACWSPLHRAYGAPKMTELLIRNGADVNLNEGYEGETPLGQLGVQLESSIEYRESPQLLRASMRLLLDAGADPNIVQHGWGWAPLHFVAAHGTLEMVQWLTDARAHVDPLTHPKKHTPLHEVCYWCRSGSSIIIRYLIGKGADINALTSEGKTPLDLAVNKGRDDEAIRTLKELGASHSIREENEPEMPSTSETNSVAAPLPEPQPISDDAPD